MKKKLFILHDIPYPDNDGGKKLSLGRIIEDSKNYEVYVLAFNYQDREEQIANDFFKSKSIEFDIYNEEFKHRGFRKILRYPKYIFSIYPAYYNRLSDKNFSGRLLNTIGKFQPDVISFETIFLFSQVKKVINDVSIRKVELVFHNVESLFFKELSLASQSIVDKIKYFIESKKISFLEDSISKILNKSQKIYAVCLSKGDSLYYENFYNFKNEKIILNKNSIYLENEIKHSPNKKNSFFLFPGSVDFPPNREGLIWLLGKYESFAELNIPIFITGSCSRENEKLFSKYDKIKFTGFLSKDELMKLYQKCVCVVSPIISGGGIKVKNVESIGLGVPIVMTKFSSIGIQFNQLKTELVMVSDNDATIFCKTLVQMYYKVMD